MVNGSVDSLRRGIQWLVAAVESDRWTEPSPIGFYFAKLWYHERLYPIIFTVAALGQACRYHVKAPQFSRRAACADPAPPQPPHVKA
jgi:hypothetical protein